MRDSLCQHFAQERERLTSLGCPVYVTLDADVVHVADVPGVSAPNALGLNGAEVIACARLAGESPNVTSFDVHSGGVWLRKARLSRLARRPIELGISSRRLRARLRTPLRTRSGFRGPLRTGLRRRYALARLPAISLRSGVRLVVTLRPS